MKSSKGDLKILYLDEWYPFDIHFGKQPKLTKSSSKSKLVTEGPNTLLRDIYKEYKMIPTERKKKEPAYNKWDVLIDKKLEMKPRGI